MKQMLLVFLTAFLVTACQSKREVCALYAAGEIGLGDAASRLGLYKDRPLSHVGVQNYCYYYQK